MNGGKILTKILIFAIILYMNTEVPEIKELTAIRPDHTQRRAPELVYPNLSKSVGSHEGYIPGMWNSFLSEDAGSPTEQYQAKQIALYYMLKTALNAVEADNPDSRRLWAQRYTQHTSELYGVPTADIAKGYLQKQLSELLWFDQITEEDKQVIKSYADLFGFQSLEAPEGEARSESRAAELVGEYLGETYKPIFQLVDDIEGDGEGIEMEVVAEVFESALEILKDQHDESWSDWSVVRDEGRALLSVDGVDSKVVVGMNRVNPTRTELKGLLAHELLVHGTRAMNGRKYSKEFGLGLSGYLTAEEGLGVFFEYAVTGVIPEKNIDRYVDVALALGLISDKPLTRQQLFEFCEFRESVRNQNRPDSQKISQQEVVERVTGHVNRIYRGTLGNEHVGVFTKDAAYQMGFIKMKAYIEDKIASGESVSQVIEFLLQGKFDPTNQDHMTYVNKTMSGRI